jgi:hypothetical protein
MTGTTRFAADCQAAWNGEAPDWVLALAAECDRRGTPGKAASACGISRATVTLLIRNRYEREARSVEAKVRGALMAATVDCPVLGELPRDRCVAHQERKLADVGTSPQHVRLYRACQTCPNNLKTGASDA